jgi:hypothetical protein
MVRMGEGAALVQLGLSERARESHLLFRSQHLVSHHNGAVAVKRIHHGRMRSGVCQIGIKDFDSEGALYRTYLHRTSAS